MKNGEIIANYNGLFALQQDEAAYYKRTGEQLLGGRIKLTYAIKKNMAMMLEKLKPYNEAFGELRKEYFDDKKADEEYKAKKEAYDKEAKGKKGLAAEPVKEDILLEGKDRKEYDDKLKELMDIDVTDVNVHTIDMEVLDGLPLATYQIDTLMFMIAD